jgi:cytochrome oxidase Cu insertion factor (SCO1/SenC/PrrC family)
MTKKFNQIIFFFIVIFFSFSTSHAYIFGLKSADNSIENIVNIEKKHNIQVPIISIIFDPWNNYSSILLKNLLAKYGSGSSNKILHLTLSPTFTAKEVAE